MKYRKGNGTEGWLPFWDKRKKVMVRGEDNSKGAPRGKCLCPQMDSSIPSGGGREELVGEKGVCMRSLDPISQNLSVGVRKRLLLGRWR